jgi:hypothetical protein
VKTNLKSIQLPRTPNSNVAGYIRAGKLGFENIRRDNIDTKEGENSEGFQGTTATNTARGTVG